MIRKLSPLIIGLAAAMLVLAALQSPSTLASPAVRTIILAHTTIEDFNRGTFFQTGMTRQGDGEVTLLRLGVAGDWITTTNATGFVPRFEHAAVAYANRLYVFGGRTDTGSLRSIQYASVNTETHDLSNWVTATTSLNTSIYTYTTGQAGVTGLSAAVLNGRVYLLGGDDGQQLFRYNTVAFATLDPDTGELGALSTTAPLPKRLVSGQAVVMGNRLYYIGGRLSPSNQGSDEVYYAQPDPVTGHITTWYSTTARLPYRTYNHMAAATVNGRLYAMSGVSVTSLIDVVPDVFYAEPLTATGDVLSWQTAKVLPNSIFEGAAVSFGGQIYATGGAKNGISDVSDLAFAALDQPSNGVQNWAATSNIVPKRLLHAAVVNDDGFIYILGGSTGTSQPIRTNIINAGATTGASGSAYVDAGTYTAEPFDLGKSYPLNHLSWVVQLPSSAVTATLRYRFAGNNGVYSAWTAQQPAAAQTGLVTSTLPLSLTARYVQYQVFFTTTLFSQTPVLYRVEIKYETPTPPEFFKFAVPASGETIQPGSAITYTLTISNVDDTPLAGTVISDVVPDNTRYVPGTIFASPGITPHTELSPTLYWEIGPLAPHTGGTVGYRVVTRDDVFSGMIIRNTANFDSETVAVRSNQVQHPIGAAYQVGRSHQTSAPPQTNGLVQPGDWITYTIVYTNPSETLTLNNVIITDVVPTGLTNAQPIGLPAPDSTLLAQGIFRWSVGTLPPSTYRELRYRAQVITSTTQIPDGFEIVGAPQMVANAQRAVVGNIDRVVVRYRFDVRLSLNDNLLTAAPGQLITYTINLTNVAVLPITATDISVVSFLEPGLPGYTRTHVLNCVAPCAGWTFVEDDVDGNSVYQRLVPALGPNQSLQLTLTALVSPTLQTTAPEVLAAAHYVQANAGSAHGVEIDPTNQSQEIQTPVAGPDLAVTGLTAGTGRLTIAKPINFYTTVTNQGFNSTLAADGTGWFGVDLYVKPVGSSAPLSPDDRYLGGCPTFTFDCPTTFRADYYRVVKFYTTTLGAGGLGLNESWPLTYTLALTTPGTYWVYVQADTYGSPYSPANGTPTYGRIMEGDEQNNIFGPLIIQVTLAKVYLPIVRR